MAIHFTGDTIMIARIKTELKKTQDRFRETQSQITEQADELVVQARHKAHLVRGDSAERLWHFENQALDWMDDVLQRTEVPGVELVKEPVSRLVKQARGTVTSNPIDGYSALNARAAADAARTLDLVDLLKLERIERSGKGRKTVFQAITRRRSQLQKLPYRDATA
jgi:hypothetical protein